MTVENTIKKYHKWLADANLAENRQHKVGDLRKNAEVLKKHMLKQAMVPNSKWSKADLSFLEPPKPVEVKPVAVKKVVKK